MDDRLEGEMWTVDTDATLQSLLADPACPGLLRRALTGIPSWQVRSETTVARTLKASSLMPQCLAALLALGAVVTIRSEDNPQSHTERRPEHRPEPVEGPVEGSVEGSAKGPIEGPAKAPLEGDVPLEDLVGRKVSGKVTALHIPTPGCHSTHWGEAHVARTSADEPIVAAFAAVRMKAGTVEEARLALTGAWPEPVRLAEASGTLVGGPLSQERIAAVAAAVEEAVEPQGDYRGSAAYRRAMAGILSRRALEACAAAPTAGGR